MVQLALNLDTRTRMQSREWNFNEWLRFPLMFVLIGFVWLTLLGSHLKSALPIVIYSERFKQCGPHDYQEIFGFLSFALRRFLRSTTKLIIIDWRIAFWSTINSPQLPTRIAISKVLNRKLENYFSSSSHGEKRFSVIQNWKWQKRRRSKRRICDGCKAGGILFWECSADAHEHKASIKLDSFSFLFLLSLFSTWRIICAKVNDTRSLITHQSVCLSTFLNIFTWHLTTDAPSRISDKASITLRSITDSFPSLL